MIGSINAKMRAKADSSQNDFQKALKMNRKQFKDWGTNLATQNYNAMGNRPVPQQRIQQKGIRNEKTKIKLMKGKR